VELPVLATGDGVADPPDGLEVGERRVALVDGGEVERLLVPGEVEVVLLLPLGDETLELVAVGVELEIRCGLGRHGCLAYGPVHEIRVRTERRSQLVDITQRVRDAIAGEVGAAVVVYVPHTTAGITINEHADPAVARDFEAALERMVEDGWPWQHVEPGEENAPTHIRASLMGPSVVIPLREDGALALGTWQGVFFCEFDGPRERSVYVSVLG
jgi:secondary thiamine-phosphate synthase enzyme